MASCAEIMAELEAGGSPQTRKTYGRHGITEPMFGVSYALLGKLKKKIKRDHALALELWPTGNHDARVLAIMIADPAAATSAQLDQWMADCHYTALADALSGYAAQTRFAREKMEQWIQADDEWTEAAGWGILGNLAHNDPALPDEFFAPYLDYIEAHIHNAKNRVRYNMNSAVINIGLRSSALQPLAIESAGRIGYVEVDHGQTNCETPDAINYIRKTLAYREGKAKGKPRLAGT
jgi:3-methyladenine DNA glycosylase AlkD